MSRNLAGALAVIAAILAVGTVGTSSSSSSSATASSSRAEVLQLRATNAQFTAVPNRPSTAAQQPGDQLFYVAQLTQDGKHIGASPHHCTAITAQYSLCEAVAVLPNGLITFQTALGGTNLPPIVKVAITGGTGEYRAVHGQLRITANSDGTQNWRLDFAER
ncbi:MAG: hypothetical protein QOE89_3468 [Pseudonocardiales bacterium]|jgi:hypothetical protein|nr:hypothetical protein [Pseudonocardiales bacterium]